MLQMQRRVQLQRMHLRNHLNRVLLRWWKPLLKSSSLKNTRLSLKA